MLYTLITYCEGRQISKHLSNDFSELLRIGVAHLESNDEYEILDPKGFILAYAYTPESKRGKQLEFDYEMERKAALEEERRGQYD
jgi:hypothetical protein